MLQLPLELINLVIGYFPENERLDLRLTCRLWNEFIMPLVLREPNWKTLGISSENLESLMDRYGHLVRFIPASDNIGLETLSVLFKKCQRVNTVYFYGKDPLWREVDKLVRHEKVEKIEYYFLGDIYSDSLISLSKFDRLTDLSITYDDSEIIYNSVKLVSDRLRKLSVFQMTFLQQRFLKLVQTKFPDLESLQLQCGSIEESAFPYFLIPMPKLKVLEVDIYLFKTKSTCFAMDAGCFPLLEHLLIDLHTTRKSGFCCNLSGVWRNLTELSLFRLNTGDPTLICNSNFPKLLSLQLQVYLPFTQDTLRKIVCDLPQLKNVELNKFNLEDSIFDIPTPFICLYQSKIEHFLLTNNTNPLGPFYLRFMLQFLTGIKDWTLPTLKSYDNSNPQSEDNSMSEETDLIGSLPGLELDQMSDHSEPDDTEVETFVRSLIATDLGPILPELGEFLLDASPASVSFAHYVAQSCPSLTYMFINLLDESLDGDHIRKEFSKLNPTLVTKVE